VALDLAKRVFVASGPDQPWVADMAYVTTGEGWLYLATALDAWNHRVVGWTMGGRLLSCPHRTIRTHPRSPTEDSRQVFIVFWAPMN